MPEFVIVVAALASLATAGPVTPGTPPVVPDQTPTVGFRTYSGAEACEAAAAQLTARAGTRLVCLPGEAQLGELVSAY